MQHTDHNLRHLRLFVTVVDTGSVTKASLICNVTQPAVTQAINRIEEICGTALFERTRQGLFPNALGQIFADRSRRALTLLDQAAELLAPRLKLTATSAKLRALVAVAQAENFSIAANMLGIAQPTIHRAVTQLEGELGRPLFRRSQHGSVPTRAGQILANAAQLAFAELHQAEMEIAESIGKGDQQITIGGMPLSRSYLLPTAIARFNRDKPNVLLRVTEGPYEILLAGLRQAELDFLIGALREPVPTQDVVQQPLFDDELTVVAAPGHPLATYDSLSLADTAGYPWIVPAQGAPARQKFNEMVAAAGLDAPHRIVETSSMILMRELMLEGDYLGCISRLQVSSELGKGLLVELPVLPRESIRQIGLTTRLDWKPTRTQAQFIALIHDIVREKT